MRKRPAGFTLLEVAVALAILGIGVVSVMQIFQGALRLQIRSADRTRAILLVREAMDGLATMTMETAEEYCSGNQKPDGIECRIDPVKPEDLGMTEEEWEERGLPDWDVGLDEGDEETRLYAVDVAWLDANGVKTFGARTFRYYNAELWENLE